MSSLARTGLKSQLADVDLGLPDIAEAEAVLLDLAKVSADPALHALLPVLNQFTENRPAPGSDERAPGKTPCVSMPAIFPEDVRKMK